MLEILIGYRRIDFGTVVSMQSVLHTTDVGSCAVIFRTRPVSVDLTAVNVNRVSLLIIPRSR